MSGRILFLPILSTLLFGFAIRSGTTADTNQSITPTKPISVSPTIQSSTISTTVGGSSVPGKPTKDGQSATTTVAKSSEIAVNSTADPQLAKEIVSGLISSFVPGAALGANGNALGSIGLLPAISKLSGPLADIINSKGRPEAEDVDQLMKALPEMAIMLGASNAMKDIPGGSNSLDNIDFSKLPPQLINYVANGGQIPGISPVDMQKLKQRYLDQVTNNASATTAPNSSSNSANAPTGNVSNWSPQQVADMISGAAPLPPLNSLPPEYVQTVLSGGALPGLTLEQTQALKQRYMQQMFGGGPMLGGLGGVPSGPALAPVASSNESGTSSSAVAPIPVISNISSPLSNNNNLLSELKNLDLSKLPPDVVQNFLAGKSLDLNKIPSDVLQSFINKSPQLFTSIVAAQLEKKINETSSIDQTGIIPDSPQSAAVRAPYDINSLDGRADISLHRGEDKSRQITLWTAVALGVVSLVTVVLIVFLCWRHHRKNNTAMVNVDHPNGRASINERVLATDTILTTPVRRNEPSVVREREVRENEDEETGVYARASNVDSMRAEPGSRVDKAEFTRTWVLTNGAPRSADDSESVW